MNDKIKELTEKRDAAFSEKYIALFAKQKADAKFREKEKIYNKIEAQLKQALQEEAEQ